MDNIMKGISCCADCAYYSMKKHRCTRASDEGKPADHFYADCPLPTVTKEQSWISVKDRLPNCNGIYLVWRPHYFGGWFEIGEPVVCYFDGQNTWHDSYGVDFERILNPDDVTHWMPLPEPPKEGT